MFDGCPAPDTDGDSLTDDIDKCPTVSGLVKYNGCPIPDSDGDKIHDEEDKCPQVPGVARYEGCPVGDQDGDGVNDDIDKCVDVKGTVANSGCPEKKIIDIAVNKNVELVARNIFFVAGTAQFLAKSYSHLNTVVTTLKADTSLRLSITGFGDVKPLTTNLQLASKRATAVKMFLQSKGVDPQRMVVKTGGEAETKTLKQGIGLKLSN